MSQGGQKVLGRLGNEHQDENAECFRTNEKSAECDGDKLSGWLDNKVMLQTSPLVLEC